MIIFVDNEHTSGYEQKWGQFLMAARTKIKYRLEDITGDTCLLIRYQHVTPQLIKEMNARAVFISGNSADPSVYDEKDKEGLRQIFRDQALPIFGFCGGFQLMGQTLGAPLELIGPLDPGEEDPFPESTYAGWKKEHGYDTVQIVKPHPILEGLGEEPIVRHAHSLELKSVPAGFQVYASTPLTHVQMIIHDTLPIAGAQFHPEYYTDEHPAGRIMIENFCKYAGII